MRQKRVLLIHYLCLQVAFPAIFLFNFIGLFFVVTTDEAGVASAVSIQEKNRENQKIMLACMDLINSKYSCKLPLVYSIVQQMRLSAVVQCNLIIFK